MIRPLAGLLPLLVSVIASASPPIVITTENGPHGRWFFDLRTPGGPLPIEVRGEIHPDRWERLADPQTSPRIVNGAESIPLALGLATDGGSFSARTRFSGFDSAITWHGVRDHLPVFWKGEWRISRRSGPTTIPFTISNRDARFVLPDEPSAIESGRYRVVFSSSPDDPAVGLFTINDDGTATGTFLTTTGDYRFLAGNAAGDTLRLSTFDGAHAFLFHAKRREDGLLEGDFWSGTWWHETWTAVPDPDFTLPDPFDRTRYQGDAASLERLLFTDPDGVPTPVGVFAASGSPRIVEVFGSWCPNCHDATRLLGELHDRYADRGLKILGLAFEHSADPERAADAVRRYRDDLGVRYPLLIAGLSDKAKASEAMPVLDRVRAFPTTLFIDADGSVRAVHSGFDGPATGDAHQRLREQWIAHIEAMLGAYEAGALPGVD